MKTNRYRMKYRPASFCTVPNGYTLEETGTRGFFPLRTDLPMGTTMFGVISYDRALSDDEVRSYELELIG